MVTPPAVVTPTPEEPAEEPEAAEEPEEEAPEAAAAPKEVGEELPFTGLDTAWIAMLGLMLLAFGFGLRRISGLRGDPLVATVEAPSGQRDAAMRRTDRS